MSSLCCHEQCSVKEYWLVDVDNKEIEVLTLTQAKYKTYGVFKAEDTLSSVVLKDFNFNVAEVFSKMSKLISVMLIMIITLGLCISTAFAEELKGLAIGGTWYLSYQNGTQKGTGFNKFCVKRGYLDVKKVIISPWLEGRITLDTTQDDSGDMKERLKYVYAKFSLPNTNFITKPNLKVGLVHTPWLDFEEHINYYRLQDTMFLERNGLFNSADFGLTFASLLGGEIDKEYQKKVNQKYPGRYGSFAIGIYNGGGYSAKEKNKNKVVETRVTIRPFPDRIPGIQLSYLDIFGKGNSTSTTLSNGPDWKLNNLMVSYEHEYFVLTGQYLLKGKGNQKGIGAHDNSGKPFDQNGYSIFGEVKIANKKASIIGRYDFFDPDTTTANNENSRIILGYAWHLDNHNTILIDYDKVSYEESGKSDDNRTQVTMQVKF